MYGKFSVGYRIIHEKATVNPNSCRPLWRMSNVSTLPGATSMATSIVKSMPVTQASQMPILSIVPSSERDMLEPFQMNKQELLI